MPKTTRDQPGRLSSRFWRLLGASTEKNRSRSLTQVTASAEYDEEAADLTDEKLRKAARLLKLDDLADSEDIPQFLAIAREAAERATGLAAVRRSAAGRTADAGRRRDRDGHR